jgi:hypothetical protein
VKSKRRAMDRLPWPGDESFRLSLLAAEALPAGPGPLRSTFPSTSSSARGEDWLADLGSLDG